ncbi:MAG: hypothetical protein IPJ73_22320 [Zoogloea sp.]|nr:hypothetical protein [Zoogloea sp.]
MPASVHGDLSEYNAPRRERPGDHRLTQAVDAAANQNASAMPARDVKQPGHLFSAGLFLNCSKTHYAEIRALYESGKLHPDSVLTGT